jgi:chemotaxis protein CheC
VFAEEETIVSFHQSFSNELLGGTTIIVFDDKTKNSISTILGMHEKMESIQEMEFMLELSNILVGACMNSISGQLFNQDMSFANPELIAEGVNLREMAYSTFMRSKLKWGYTLLVTISLYIKDKFFKCDLIVFMSEKDTEVIRTSIQEMMPED